jgi:hypothetical protein
MCRGINFCTNKIKKIILHGLSKTILTNHLWKGGRPSLNTRALCKRGTARPECLVFNKEKRNTIEATLCEIKYFKVVSAEVIFCIDTKIGIIANIFTSRPTHKKRRELADSLSKMLIIVIIKNPVKADINIINL